MSFVFYYVEGTNKLANDVLIDSIKHEYLFYCSDVIVNNLFLSLTVNKRDGAVLSATVNWYFYDIMKIWFIIIIKRKYFAIKWNFAPGLHKTFSDNLPNKTKKNCLLLRSSKLHQLYISCFSIMFGRTV